MSVWVFEIGIHAYEFIGFGAGFFDVFGFVMGSLSNELDLFCSYISVIVILISGLRTQYPSGSSAKAMCLIRPSDNFL